MSKKKFIRRKAEWKDTALSAAGVITGVAVSGFIKKSLTKETLEGLGLNGEVSNYVVPGVLTAIGIAGAGFVSDKFTRSAALGITAVGGAGLLNELAGKEVVSLGNAEQVAIPGIGSNRKAIPGIGRTPYIPQPLPRPLPKNNQELELNPDLSREPILNGMGCF